MTSPAPGQPPFAFDGTVTRDKLLELLAVQTELPELDYKQECDLSSAAALIELTKDIGAMNILTWWVGVELGHPDAEARLTAAGHDAY